MIVVAAEQPERTQIRSQCKIEVPETYASGL